MEVRIPDFFKRHLGRIMAVLITLQLLLTCGAALGTWFFWHQGMPVITALAIGFGSLLAIQAILTPIFIYAASKPLRIISQAIAHVSKDPVQTAPPNLSSRRYERNGLRAMVQTIYELAARSPGTVPQVLQPSLQPQTIFDHAPVGLIGFDAAGTILMANKLAPVRKNSDGQLTLSLQFEADKGLSDWLRATQVEKLRDTKTWSRIADRLPGEPQRRIYDIVACYNKGDVGGIETIATTIDRTGQYVPLEEEMDFIALAAHELRGPITVIRGYLDIADDELQGKLLPSQQELLDRLKVASEQLSGYINNILGVARYDRNHMQLHLHEEKLITIFRELLPGLMLRAKTKKRRLTFFIPETLPTIAADSSSLSEVINNLIDNAIKYSPPNGEIITKAVVNGDFVEITVQDFGIGMPASIVGNLFTKFYRSHRSREQVGGTGLGLYICKAIVESHGGHIWVRSQEAKGSTFGFTIPIYRTVADRLAKGDNRNEQVIEKREGWIKNHSMYLQ